MVRYTVKLPDGRLFHLKDERAADLFALKHGGTRMPFSVELLPADLRKILGI